MGLGGGFREELREVRGLDTCPELVFPPKGMLSHVRRLRVRQGKYTDSVHLLTLKESPDVYQL